MKERPIIFNTENVRAILEGRKTQTRRVIKLPCAPNHLGQWEATYLGGDGTTKDSLGNIVPRIDGIWHTRTGKFIKCPYGGIGDLLWVRETWRMSSHLNGEKCPCYKADNMCLCGRPSRISVAESQWKPSIHMFRKDSRITLEITGIRVERLQEITKEDALAEGLIYHEGFSQWYISSNTLVFGHKTAFQILWDSLNAKRGYGWETNCWVWVISFNTTK